jgi:aryl-alcohol dehydrogenase-like predicted oxidoreductase
MSELPARRLRDSELEATIVGLGCNNFGRRLDLDGTRAVVDAALDAGINLLDTADVYGGEHGRSEELLGEALRRHRRDEVIVATKFGGNLRGVAGDPPGAPGSAPYVRWACEGSLRRLGVETIDLYQYHVPNWDVPIEETLDALDALVRDGKVRYVGCSNFTAGQLLEAERVSRVDRVVHFVTLQNEYSLLRREIERDVIPVCERLGVSVLPYFPLASGLLSGKYSRGEAAPAGTRLAGRDSLATDVEWDALEALERFAAERGVELIDVAIGALAAQPMVASVIAGATTPEQARRNAQAGLWRPSAEDLEEIDRIVPPRRPFAPGAREASRA